MARYAMVIDLHKCIGCGACAITCKNENNVGEGIFWSHYLKRTVGTFPHVKYEFIPTLCNHCDNAPCVKACPTRAMHKDADRLTLHDPAKCLGCKSCMLACPYNVISFNKKKPHEAWLGTAAIIPGGTAGWQEVVEKVGEKLPYYNPDRAATYAGIRPKGIVEKCTFCDHRLKQGEQPYCAVSCPAEARVVGDLDDPNSEINVLLSKYGYRQLRPEQGTKPKVFYLRQY